MRNARARAALLAVLVAACVGAVAPSQASGFVSYYNCVNKPVGVWCDGRANGSYDGQHSWDFNQGWYPGAWDGSVIACQRVWKPSSGNELPGASCGVNYTDHYYGNVQCACYDAEVRQYSSGPRSINGYADAAF